jgi:hypothetical protein
MKLVVSFNEGPRLGGLRLLDAARVACGDPTLKLEEVEVVNGSWETEIVIDEAIARKYGLCLDQNRQHLVQERHFSETYDCVRCLPSPDPKASRGQVILRWDLEKCLAEGAFE